MQKKHIYFFAGFVVCGGVLAGCGTTPGSLGTEAVGVEAQYRLDAAPEDARAIGEAMEAEEKPWKKKKDEESSDGMTQQEGAPDDMMEDDNTSNDKDMAQEFDRSRAQALAARYTGAVMHTNKGDITFELYGTDAPLTVGNFLMLAEDGFYDDVIFHRIIQDFMIQGGDPTGTGTGGPGYKFEDEINQHKIVRGALAMANAGPGTNGSQFFIVTTEAAAWLDGKHTVFGAVTDGMATVDAIEAVRTDGADKPFDDVVITGIDLVSAE